MRSVISFSGLVPFVCLLSKTVDASYHHILAIDDHNQPQLYDQTVSSKHTETVNNRDDPLPKATREHWMRQARQALEDVTGSPCPFAAFGTAIVNHTNQPEDSLGEMICIGANAYAKTGNPVLHGEIAAINNCTTILSQPPHSLKPSQITAAWKDFTLYTTAEPCTMCASAIAWGLFKEYVFATSIWTLVDFGWSEPKVASKEMIELSPANGITTGYGGVLAEEMDELFKWQYDVKAECPRGCVRTNGGEKKTKCVKA